VARRKQEDDLPRVIDDPVVDPVDQPLVVHSYSPLRIIH